MLTHITPFLATPLLALGLAGPVSAETFSNRHHLSDCTAQSAPVVIPYADARTVRLGLPADIGGQARIAEIYGYDEETRLRLRRRGLSVNTEGGGATLMMPHQSDC